MSVRIKILLSVFSVLLLGSVSAQEFYDSFNPLTTESNTLNYKLTGNQYYFQTTLRGTVYLNDKWTLGSVKLENGDQYENVYMKLNTYLEQLVVYNERNGAIFYLDKSIISEFKIELENNLPALFRKVYFDKAPRGDHYFNVLYDGKVKLYYWYRTMERQTSPYKDDYGFLRASIYEPSNVYLMVLPDNTVYRVVPRRVSFLKLFPEQKPALRKAFRKNRIHFYNKSEDIIKTVQLIEQELF